MPIETDLSVSPYFDEAAAGLEKNYYKVLFKPAVPVQVRELNELQSILQNQIEEFGDNILKKGTIIRGCTFSFFNNYPYVKINDSQLDGAPVNISALMGKTVTSGSGHSAIVIDYADGFESTDPNTKTLYLRYINSGDEGGNAAFEANDVLIVQDPTFGISNVTISLAGAGYSNSDTVVFTSAVALTNIQGTLQVGDTMTQPTTGANAVIISVDNTTYPERTILKIRPVTGDLNNTSKTAADWTFTPGVGIKSLANSAITATVDEVIGTGAAAVITTDGTQRVIDVSMITGGSGYYVAPYAVVRSAGGGAGASLVAQNYAAKVVVYNGAAPVGLGYGFGVSEGVIYQKGYFLRVPEQSIVVSKYNRFPNNVSVGFSTIEEIVDAYEDTELLDNALGSRNYTAPGADRLKLTPTLMAVNTDIASSNNEFFAIVEFSEGVPYKQNQRTVYVGITDEMALRTQESAGDFVTDQFLVACKSVANTALRANSFSVVVDPGSGYIEGYRVKTYGNYEYSLEKGTDVATKNGASISMSYGSYITVDNLSGSFDFSAVGTVKLYNVAAGYLTGNSTNIPYSNSTISAPVGGLQIGTAKVRSIVSADGTSGLYPQGSPNSRYNMYIFDIQMSAGKSFKDVKSVFYDSTVKGIADVVLDDITSPGATVKVYGAVLKKTTGADKKSLDKMVFYSGFDSPLSINTINYQYRTFDDNNRFTMGNNGVISISLSGNEYFPYNGDLSDAQRLELLFMPKETVKATLAAGGAGYANVSATSNTIISTNTSFATGLRIGDYVLISEDNTGDSAIRRITKINSANSITVDANVGFTNTAATAWRAFPAYVPLPILTREGVLATGSVSGQQLTINFGLDLNYVSNTIPLAGAFNVVVNNAQVATKSPNRDLFVKIYPANNETGFGYSEYGTGVNGTFTSGSNAVSSTVTSGFTNGQKLKVIKGTSNTVVTVGTIVNSSHMTLTNPVYFTGTADLYPAINLNGPWCLGIPDIFRLKNVYMAKTSAVNVNSTDVTRDFVIDHNHNPNYIDLGYLVKKKGSTLVIGPNDYLLVKLDAFTRDYSDRPVHINSYVSSDATTRANVDAKSLSQLNNSYVNTWELPEIHAASGTEYDMISHIDFRPTVANTAVLTTTVASANINPPYTVTFNASDKKFPVPDSTMRFNASYFQGRIDTVYIGSDGKIGTANGHPYPTPALNSSKVDRLLTPVPNEGTMILNHIKIPAYPSIEENAASSISSVVNKNVINETYLTKRLTDKKITRLLDRQDLEIEQPRRYSMEDIGQLERRIKDLEYYVSLSNLELSTKDLSLPSSIAKNINRFKFGFFADAFDDTTYTDINSIEYAASIERKRLIPSYEVIKVGLPAMPGGDDFDFSIVSQLKATGNAQSSNTNVNTAFIQVTQGDEKFDAVTQMLFALNPFYQLSEDAYIGQKKGLVVAMANNLANTPGDVKVYMSFYGGADVLSIYQSTSPNTFPTTPIYTTGSAVPLTTADQNYLYSLPDGFFRVDQPNTGNPPQLNKFQIVNNPTNGLRWGGKITFKHNPANGNYYKFETSRYSYFYRYRVEYPINVSSDGSSPGGPTGVPSYNGTIKFYETMQVKVTNNDDVSTFYRIHFSVSGLRPSTKHKVYFSGVDLSHLCDTTIRQTVVPIPPNVSATSNETWKDYASRIPDFFTEFSAPNWVMTDAGGKFEAYLYVQSDEVLDVSSSAKKTVTAEYDVLRNPVIEVYTPDKSSYAYKVTSATFKLFSGFRKI